jgi:tetratricopeptide (TPR) repeat protein
MAAEFRQHDEHGFPVHTRFEDIPHADDPPPRRRQVNMKAKRLVLIGLLVAVVIPLVFGERLISAGRWQLARWFNNRAAQKYLSGDIQGALVDMDRAVDWRPDSWEFRDMRARMREQAGNLEGSLADLNEGISLLEKRDDDRPQRHRREIDRNMALLRLHLARCRVHVRLNHARPAIDDANRAVVIYPSPLSLNNRAYMRAVLNIELEEGLADIEEAIKQSPGKQPDYLDTRAYLLHLLGRNEEALKDMNEAIRLVQPAWGRSFLGRFEAEERRQYEQAQAVMYHHRGLIYEKLGKKTEAEADLRRADALGYDPANGVF